MELQRNYPLFKMWEELEMIDQELRDYKDLPDEVRKMITSNEFDTLKQIQNHFSESVDYLHRFFSNDDTRQNLYYVVHDWIGERGQDHNRNDALLAELKEASDILERLDRRLEIET